MERISDNEKLQWSMKNEKLPLKNYCTDKLKVKEYIAEKLGKGFVPEVFVVAENINELLSKVESFEDHPQTCLIKANNDSGGVAFVNEGVVDQEKLTLVEKYKNSVYDGYYRGEWFYGDIQYKCFTEEYLGHNLTDYKFHCSAGEPRFCQVIRDRNIGQINEVCTDMDGNCYDFHFDLNFKLVKEFEKPKNWERMKEIAKILSEPFDYVRVDMYNLNIEDSTDKSLFIGELTFAPMSGDYRGPGQIEAGKLLIGM